MGTVSEGARRSTPRAPAHETAPHRTEHPRLGGSRPWSQSRRLPSSVAWPPLPAKVRLRPRKSTALRTIRVPLAMPSVAHELYCPVLSKLPQALKWVLWDLDFERLVPEADADSIIARVMEHGRLADVRAILALYGQDRILRFFRQSAHPIVSDRTRHFWRAYFHAEDESWPHPPAWRKNNAAPWID